MTPGSLLEAFAQMLVCGTWVLVLALMGDRLVGVPTFELIGDDLESESRRRRFLTKAMLKRRMVAVPLAVILPTAVLTGAVSVFATEALDLPLLRYLWALALIISGATIYDCLARLRYTSN